MAGLGCRVFAFDPGNAKPRLPKENVEFHHWGLMGSAGAAEQEKQFTSLAYGKTNEGEYLSLPDIMQRLGHTDKKITLFKIDCEGCEWAVFKGIYDQSVRQFPLCA